METDNYEEQKVGPSNSPYSLKNKTDKNQLNSKGFKLERMLSVVPKKRVNDRNYKDEEKIH